MYTWPTLRQDIGKVELFLSGENFRASRGARCRFGGAGSPTSAAFVLESGEGLTCRVPGGLTLASSPYGRRLEVEVAMNGVDFVGGSPPVLLRLHPGSSVARAAPSHVYATGRVPITVYGSNFGPHLRFCIFGEGEEATEVRGPRVCTRVSHEVDHP